VPLLTCAVIVGAAFALLSDAPHLRAQTNDTITDPDAYAVYASTLAGSSFISDNNRTPLTRIAILEETRTFTQCLSRVSSDWAEVVEQFKIENARVRKLLPGFGLGLPYHLISAAYLKQLQAQSYRYVERETAGRRPNYPRPFARFPGGKLLLLSAVGFNMDKTPRPLDCPVHVWV
jgi:hypothetical protein